MLIGEGPATTKSEGVAATRAREAVEPAEASGAVVRMRCPEHGIGNNSGLERAPDHKSQRLSS